MIQRYFQLEMTAFSSRVGGWPQVDFLVALTRQLSYRLWGEDSGAASIPS